MDYLRIYRDFIADRRNIETYLVGYSERHHITPKSLGGTDNADNLIRLTPEDHYFAHLLLAKVYGGSQWGALHCMAVMINNATEMRRILAGRYMFGVARRKFADFQRQRLSGSRQAHKEQFGTLHHDDGRSVTGTRTQIADATGVSIASVSRLCNGKQGRSSCGWYADKDVSDRAISQRAMRGLQQSPAGMNKRMVRRVDCGTLYESLTHAAAAWSTNTSNISRAIRLSVRAGGSYWEYDGQTEKPATPAWCAKAVPHSAA